MVYTKGIKLEILKHKCVWIAFSISISLSFPPLSDILLFLPFSLFPLPPSIYPSIPPFLFSGCQAMFSCHGNEWYSKDLKVHTWSCHLYSCSCCYHWYPTYNIWLLLPCTAGGALLPWFSGSIMGVYAPPNHLGGVWPGWEPGTMLCSHDHMIYIATARYIWVTNISYVDQVMDIKQILCNSR